MPYYTVVRWLSCGKVLSKLFALRKEINLFFKEKNKPQEVLALFIFCPFVNWLWNLKNAGRRQFAIYPLIITVGG